MRYCYETKTFSFKLTKLLDKKYSTLKSHKRRPAFINDFHKHFEVDISSTSRQWFIGNAKPSLDNLMCICELLNCDIDYFLTEQEELKKEIKSAAEVTGLEYETIEILEKIKNSEFKDTDNYIDKCILFLLDFLLQRANGREILHNMFYYLFKQHNLCYTQPFIFSPSLCLKDTSDISVNDLEINANSFSEQYFYSKLLTDIVTFKEQEKTKSIDIAKTIYPLTPEEFEDVNNELDELEKDDAFLNLPTKEEIYKKFNIPESYRDMLEYRISEEQKNYHKKQYIQELRNYAYNELKESEKYK